MTPSPRNPQFLKEISQTLEIPEDHVRFICHGPNRSSLEIAVKGTEERTAEELVQDLIGMVQSEGNPVSARMRWAEVHGHVSEQVCRMISSSFKVRFI